MRTLPTSLIAIFAFILPKVMIWATLFFAVLVLRVFDHLAPSFHADIDVDIGEGGALWVDEALEEEVESRGGRYR